MTLTAIMLLIKVMFHKYMLGSCITVMSTLSAEQLSRW